MTRNQLAYQSMLSNERLTREAHGIEESRLDIARDDLEERVRHNLRTETQKDVEVAIKGAEAGFKMVKDTLSALGGSTPPTNPSPKKTPNTHVPVIGG